MIGAWLRRLAERLSRDVILKRRLPARFGARSILVTPDSRLAYWRYDLERVTPDLFRWVDDCVDEGMTIWDVGANLGLFSLAAAVRTGGGGNVVAVEPDPELSRLLYQSAAMESELPEAPVAILPVAADSDNGLVSLQVARRGRSSNFVAKHRGGSQSGGTRYELDVLAVTLDWLRTVLPPPDLVKLDVEGGESAVLSGSRELLAQDRPVLLVEVYDRNREDVGDLLKEADYRMFDAEVPDPFWQDPLSLPVNNTLCVPSEISIEGRRFP